MACDPHSQVLTPCAEDAASSLQGLGTRGDIAWTEYGSMPLSAGQTEVEITFNYEKIDWRYVFDYLYVGYFDGTAIDSITAVSGNQTTKKFKVKLSGPPTTEDAILFWEVRVPDNLQECQPVTSSPQYAIVPPAQKGEESLVVDQDFIEVVFPQEHPTSNWYPELIIENGAADIPQVFAYTMTSRSEFGFRLQFQGAPTEDGYVLRWRIS